MPAARTDVVSGTVVAAATAVTLGAVADCENCGREDDELVVVRRLYVFPATEDQPERVQVVDEPERWCVSCVSQYPCEPAG